MRTQVRYLSIEGAHPHFLGWYEPAHFVLEANAQLIAQRCGQLIVVTVVPDGAPPLIYFERDGRRRRLYAVVYTPPTVFRSTVGSGPRAGRPEAFNARIAACRTSVHGIPWTI